MNHSDLIDKFFPFPQYNPGQKEAIQDCIDNILKGTRHIIMELPTGIGKS